MMTILSWQQYISSCSTTTTMANIMVATPNSMHDVEMILFSRISKDIRTLETKGNCGQILCSLEGNYRDNCCDLLWSLLPPCMSPWLSPIGGMANFVRTLTNKITSILDVTSSIIIDRIMATTDLVKKRTPLNQPHHLRDTEEGSTMGKNEEYNKEETASAEKLSFGALRHINCFCTVETSHNQIIHNTAINCMFYIKNIWG